VEDHRRQAYRAKAKDDIHRYAAEGVTILPSVWFPSRFSVVEGSAAAVIASGGSGERWIRSTFGLAGAQAAGQAILAAASFLVVRLYSPAQVGAAAAVIGAAAVLAGTSALRLDLAVVLVKSEQAVAEVLALCLGVVVAIAALCEAVAILAGGWLSSELGAPSGTANLRFAVGPIVGLMGLALVLSRWSQHRRDYAALGQAQLGQCAGQAAGQVGLGAAGLGAAGLIGAVLAGSAVAIIRLGRAPLAAVRSCPRPSRSRVRELLARHRDLTTWSVVAFVANGASLGLVPLVLAGLYGVRTAGLYALAQRVLDVPSRALGTAASSTFFGDGAALSREAPERLRPRLRSTVRVLAVIGAVPALVCLFWGPDMFSALFGHRWRMAGELAGPLAILALLQLVCTAVLQTFTIVDRLRTQAGLALVRLVLTLLPIVVVGLVGASAEAAIVAMVVGAGIGNAWMIGLSDRLSARAGAGASLRSPCR
jgi:O-antigen/teichoic acid export membrane protein